MDDHLVFNEKRETEPPLDPRFGEEDTPETSETTSGSDATTVYVDFKPDDPNNPFHFSRTRKWAITLVASALTGLSASASSSFTIGDESMKRDLNASDMQVSLSLSVFALGFGVVPLLTASLSEEFGRRPLYLVSSFIFWMTHIGLALAQNIQTVLFFRFLQGAAGSTGATMVGGTVADIWLTNERGLPMSVFALAAVGSTGLGPVFAGYIEQNRHLQWRWIQWVHSIVAGIYFIFVIGIMRETRGGVLLTRQARRLRKETGDSRYKARIEDERESLMTLIWISCTRPIYLLFTEPVVAGFSLWIGFAWGILYGQVESVPLVFRTLYGFNEGEIGLVFLFLFFGALLGFIANFYQERLYQKHVAHRGPEARLYSACLAGVLFPTGCLIYAWTSFPQVSWIGPFIGLTIFIFAIFLIYLSVFSYLADCYLIYASSALAGQSLCRNLSAAAFPLFTNQMYTRLTFKWASTLLGCIAWLMAPIPVVLFFWGPKIRARSRFAIRLENWKKQQQ